MWWGPKECRPSRVAGNLLYVVRDLHLLAKAIAPPPEKFHGLQDVEERLRRRYLDLSLRPKRANDSGSVRS